MNPSTRDWHTMWSGQTSGWWLIQWIRMSTYKLLGISTPSRTKGLVSHRLIKGTVLCMRITSFRNTVVYLRRLISSLINLISNDLFKAVLKPKEPGHIAHLSNNNQHKHFTVFRASNSKYLDILVQYISFCSIFFLTNF